MSTFLNRMLKIDKLEKEEGINAADTEAKAIVDDMI